MEPYTEQQQVLSEAATLLSPFAVGALPEVLRHPSVLRPSLIQERSAQLPAASRERVRSLRSYGPKVKVLPAPSSDEESEPRTATTREVSESVIDSQDIILTDFPPVYHSQYPALFISNVDSEFSSDDFTTKMKGYCEGVLRVDYTVFNIENTCMNCAIVRFRTLDSARMVFRKLEKGSAKGRLAGWLYDLPGSQHRMEVKWFCNNTRASTKEWHAAVLRGLDECMTADALSRRLRRFHCTVEPVRRINSSLCTVVVLPSLKQGYKLLKLFPSLNIKGTVNIHPEDSLFKAPGNYVNLLVKGAVKRSRPYTDAKRPLEFEPEERPTTSEIHEEGEISETEPPDVDFYFLFEFAGCYSLRHRRSLRHSGHVIHTFLNK